MTLRLYLPSFYYSEDYLESASRPTGFTWISVFLRSDWYLYNPEGELISKFELVISIFEDFEGTDFPITFAIDIHDKQTNQC